MRLEHLKYILYLGLILKRQQYFPWWTSKKLPPMKKIQGGTAPFSSSCNKAELCTWGSHKKLLLQFFWTKLSSVEGNRSRKTSVPWKASKEKRERLLIWEDAFYSRKKKKKKDCICSLSVKFLTKKIRTTYITYMNCAMVLPFHRQIIQILKHRFCWLSSPWMDHPIP